MQIPEKAATMALVCAFAFSIAGCGGQPSLPDQPVNVQDAAIEQLDGMSGAKITLAGTEDRLDSVEVTLEDGESLVIMGTLDQGNIEIAISKDGELFGTDYQYEGSSISVSDLDPGTYTLDLTLNEPSVGTMHVLALPTEVTDQLDWGNADTDTLIQEVLDYIG